MTRPTGVPPNLEHICIECGVRVTSNRVVTLRASAVVGDAIKRAGTREIARGDMAFCQPCHGQLFGSYAMQYRYPELFGTPR